MGCIVVCMVSFADVTIGRFNGRWLNGDVA